MKRVTIAQAVAALFFLACGSGQALAQIANCSTSNGASFSGVITGTTLTTSIGTGSGSNSGVIVGTTLTTSIGTGTGYAYGTISGTTLTISTATGSFNGVISGTTGQTTGTRLTTSIGTGTGSHTGSISGNTLTFSVSGSGFAIGQVLSSTGTGINVTPGTMIIAGSGTSWTVVPSQTVSSRTINGAFAGTTGTPAIGQIITSGAAAGTTITANPGTNEWTVSTTQGVLSETAMATAFQSGVAVGQVITSGAGTGTMVTAANGSNWTVTPSQTVSTAAAMPTAFASSSGTVATGQVLSGTGVTTGTTITGGSGNTWTVTPSQTAAGEASEDTISWSYKTSSGTVAINQGVLGTAVTAGTTITGGSGNSWTLSGSPTAITASTALTTTEDLTTTAAIQLLLNNSGSWACCGPYKYADMTATNGVSLPLGQQDHEALFGTVVYDAKNGSTSGADPAGQVATVTFTDGTSTTPAFITYTYTSGGVYPMYISYSAIGQATGLGTYTFCSDSTASPAFHHTVVVHSGNS